MHSAEIRVHVFKMYFLQLSNMPGRLSSLISVTRPSKPSIVSMATRIKGQFPATSLTFKCPFVTFLCCQHLISAGEKEPKVCLNWALCTLYWAASYQITWCFLLINITCCTVFLKLLSSNPHAVLSSTYETFSFKLHFRFVHARKLPRFQCVSSGSCVHTILFTFFFFFFVKIAVWASLWLGQTSWFLFLWVYACPWATKVCVCSLAVY